MSGSGGGKPGGSFFGCNHRHTERVVERVIIEQDLREITLDEFRKLTENLSGETVIEVSAATKLQLLAAQFQLKAEAWAKKNS